MEVLEAEALLGIVERLLAPLRAEGAVERAVVFGLSGCELRFVGVRGVALRVESEEFDLGLKVRAIALLNAFVNELHEGKYVLSGGSFLVNDEVRVNRGNLRAALRAALEVEGLGHEGDRVSGRIHEDLAR